MGVLYVILWLLAGIAGLIALCLLLLSVSVGVFISNRSGQTKVVARYGIFRYKLAPKKAPAKKKARKAARKAKKPPKKTGKLGAEKNRFKTFVTAIFRYDYEYLKIFCVKHIYVDYRVGGEDFADIGRKYARASELIGAAFPFLMRTFRIKKYRVTVIPDFVMKKTEFIYDIILLIRPVRLISAYMHWREGEKARGANTSDGTKKASSNKRSSVSGARPDGDA